jgi:sulfate adenylyltransferase subunit 1
VDGDGAAGGGGAPATRLLRVAAVGSVDDGKSTLIGRLLHDTRQLPVDQLEALSWASRRRGIPGVDLSFVTDGLRAEREQGITIDVAYRYAASSTRKLVIADCPGHVQYTRNMATGASTADLALVVVDVTTGLREQTRRHCCIVALLGVRQLVVAANKMDLAGWDRGAHRTVAGAVEELAGRLGLEAPAVVPVSALHGDNVVEPSARMPWYGGPTVLGLLEQAPAGAWAGRGTPGAARLPVQWVIRGAGGGRRYAGMVSGGVLRVGDEVVVLPGGARTTVAGIATFDGPLAEAGPSLSVTVELADDLDVGRGDLVAHASDPPPVTEALLATVCWFGPRPLEAGQRYRLKHTTRVLGARVASVEGRLDLDHLRLEEAERLADNDIGLVRLQLAGPLAVDPYGANRVTGSFVVIDEHTNATVAAAMVGPPALGGAEGLG